MSTNTSAAQTKMPIITTPLSSSSSPRTAQEYLRTAAHPPPLFSTTVVRSSRTTNESVRFPHQAASSPSSFPFPSSSSPRKHALSTVVSSSNVKHTDGKQTQTPQPPKHEGKVGQNRHGVSNPHPPPYSSSDAKDLQRSYASSLPRVPLAAAATAQLSPARRQQLALAGLSPKSPLELLSSIAVVGDGGSGEGKEKGNEGEVGEHRGGGTCSHPDSQKGTTAVGSSVGWASQPKREDEKEDKNTTLGRGVEEEEQMRRTAIPSREGPPNTNNNTLFNNTRGAATLAINVTTVSPRRGGEAIRDRQRGAFGGRRFKRGGGGRRAMLRAREIQCFSSPLSCEGAEVDVANGSGGAFVSSGESPFFSPTFSALPTTGAINSLSSSSARHRVAGGASSSSSPASLPLGTTQHDTPSHPNFSPIPSSFSSPQLSPLSPATSSSSASAPSSLLLRTFDKITGQLMHVSSSTYESAKALARDQYRVDRADPSCLAEAAKNVLALPLREQMQLAERRFYRLSRERAQRRYGVMGGGAFLWGEEEDDAEGADGDGEDIMMSSGSAWTTKGGGGQGGTPSTRRDEDEVEDGHRGGGGKGKGSNLVVVQLCANSALPLHQGGRSSVAVPSPPSLKVRSDDGGPPASASSRSSRRRSDEKKSTENANATSNTITTTPSRTKSKSSNSMVNKSSSVANVGGGSGSSNGGYSIFPPTSTLPATSRFVHQRSLFEAHTALGEIAMHLGKPTASVGANKMHRAAVDQFLLERSQAEADRYLTILTSNLLPENLPPVELLQLRLDAIRHRSIPIGRRPDGMATMVGASVAPTVAEGSGGRSGGSVRAREHPEVGEDHQRSYSVGHRSRRSHQTEASSGKQHQPTSAAVAQHYSSQPSVQATTNYTPRLSSSTPFSSNGNPNTFVRGQEESLGAR